MRRDLRTRLIVPTALVMTSFGPACGDDKPSTTSDTEAQTETSAATEATEASTTDVSTTGEPGTSQPTTGETSDETSDVSTSSTGGTTSATGSDDTSSEETGGELPDCSVFDGDMAACQEMVGCAWEFELETCIIDCTVIHDQATCDKAMICFWADDVCYPPI